jgi:hypothetical protein
MTAGHSRHVFHSGVRRRRLAGIFLSMIVMTYSLRGAVGDTRADSTDYESTNSTPYERAALIGASAVLIPLAIAAAAVSVAPPSAGLLIDHGTSYATLGFESGFGIGTARETGRFADERLMVSYVHVYHPQQRDIWRAEAVKDVACCFLDKRKLLLLGASPFAGVFTRGADEGYSLGASVRIMVPSLPYVGFFPLHTVGITYRYNKYFTGSAFHTLALGISAAVIF